MNSNKKLKLLFLLLCIYLATSPVYWLPSVPYTMFKPIKIAIISLVIIIFLWKFFISRYRKLELPYLLSFPIIVLIILLLPFLYVSVDSGKGLGESFNYYLNILFGFLTALMVYNNYNLFSTKKWLYIIPFITVVLISIPPFTNFVFNYPEWKVPVKAENYFDEFLWYSGFNFSRTGWSVSLSLFVPLALLVFNEKKKLKSTHFLLFIILISPIIAAQAVSGGRGGLLASLISVFILFIIYFGAKYLVLFIFAAYMLAKEFKEDIFIAMRIYDVSGKSNTIEDISSYRLSQFRFFDEIVLEQPLFGWGFKGSEAGILKYTGNAFEMHNSSLRVVIDHGMIFGTIIIILLLFIIYSSFVLLKNKKTPRIVHVNSCILISVLVASMFEPNVIFGGFQLCAFWWVALGYNLKYYKLNF